MLFRYKMYTEFDKFYIAAFRSFNSMRLEHAIRASYCNLTRTNSTVLCIIIHAPGPVQ